MKLHSQVTIRYYKKALLAVCLCIGVFAGDNVFCEPAENGLSQNSEVRSQKLCEKGFECFDDFIVYLKDYREPVFRDEQGAIGKNRILLCNLVIELNQGMGFSKERIELRKSIYKTLKELSGLPKIEKGLKEVIKNAIKIRLNNFMGAETIKKVYFIKFLLL